MTPLRTLVTAILIATATTLPAGAASTLPPLPFDHIMPHRELSDLLRSWADARPQLLELESLGRTPGGREIWFLALTNRATGAAAAKPALLVDGNEHATEWTGGVAALHLAWTLLRDYGSDERVTRLLDTRTVYVLPRMSPDGVDATIAGDRFIRSVDRPHPSPEPEPGLHHGDVDGDGRAVFMRLRDPNGSWKVHPDEPRLLVPRAPDEHGGEYWRLLPEGLIVGWDGATIGDAQSLYGLDFGTTFPSDRGSGPADRSLADPAAVPEVAAYVAAVAGRPNIVAHVSCHTFGGLVLTPPVNPSDPLPAFDRGVYRVMGARAAELTGYRPVSYLELRGEDTQAFIPTTFGWFYQRLGVLSYITEFWNPLAAAGISLEGTTASAWLWGHHPVEDELALLRWNDTELDGDGFVAWRPFDHPQLGPVEIGGWDTIRYWYNVPFDRLEAEVAPHTRWLIFHALALPRLQIRSASAEAVAENLWRVRLVVENAGWLPTNGSQRALDLGAVGEVVAELELPPGVELLEGAVVEPLGQLAGRTRQLSSATWWSYQPGTPDRAMAEWLIAAPAGTTLALAARHDRAGSDSAVLELR